MTNGIRTWKRTSNDKTLPLDERILETTQQDMASAIREADFVTLPRLVISQRTGEVLTDGYPDAYARRVAEALRAQFGYAGKMRSSQSGASHVFERSALAGSAFDFGLEQQTPVPQTPQNGYVAA